MERVAVYPGSFDPIHGGHADIIEQAARVFDKLIILIAINPEKTYTATVEERKEIIEGFLKDYKNVSVEITNKPVVLYCAEHGINYIVKGIRNQTDLDFEEQQKYFNIHLCHTMMVVYFTPTYAHNKEVSSTAIRGTIGIRHDDFLRGVLSAAYDNAPVTDTYIKRTKRKVLVTYVKHQRKNRKA